MQLALFLLLRKSLGVVAGMVLLGATAGAETPAARLNHELPLLPTFAGVRLEPGRWSNPWTPSDWGEPKLSGHDWSPANVSIDGGDLVLRMTGSNAAQVQARAATASRSATFEVDSTLPEMRPGLIAAPLWLYSHDTRDEIDFEATGPKGLTVTVYARGAAVYSETLIRGNLSGRRYRLAIEYQAGRRIVFWIDGVARAEVTPASTARGAFPDAPLKPLIELWPTMSEEWAGRWTPLGSGESLTMRIHGYRSSGPA